VLLFLPIVSNFGRKIDNLLINHCYDHLFMHTRMVFVLVNKVIFSGKKYLQNHNIDPKRSFPSFLFIFASTAASHVYIQEGCL
jgi:hypothetical protein